MVTFLLTGSSARKLRRRHADLPAGRARRREMRSLWFPEIDRIEIERVVVSGLLPPHFISQDRVDEIRAQGRGISRAGREAVSRSRRA